MSRGLLTVVAIVLGFGAAAAPPNVLFIMTDDQGPWAWGGGGHPDARTPHLDRLRAEGARLDNYLVTTPVCSPARGSLLTSRYPTEFGFTDYLSPEEDRGRGLDPSFPAWPRVFREAGYRTALVGKWHLGATEDSHPSRFGYDHFAGWRHGPGVSKDPKVEIGGVESVVKGYTSDIVTDLALEFIARDPSRPFLVSLHFWAPHANTGVSASDGGRTWLPVRPEDWAPFAELDPTLPVPSHPDLDVTRAKRMTREYLASVHSVDRNLGRILDYLDAGGLAENTIVVFTSDHGFNMGHHGIWHKGNGRWLLVNKQSNRTNLWDTSVRAPALVRWPAGIGPGVPVTRTTSNLDWFPTLLALAELPLPPDAKPRGQNFAPLLRGENVPWNDDFLMQYGQRPSPDDAGDLRGYRTPEWKLVRDFRNTGNDELYHLAVDPAESRNLIADTACRERLSALDSALRAAMAEIDDPALASFQPAVSETP